MKNICTVSIALLFITTTNAQQKSLVADHEKIFTATELTNLDTLLQKYKRSTGKIVLIATDTADVSSGYYTDNLVNQFVTDSTNKPYIFMLLLSRKNQLILASVNDKVKPYIKEKTLYEILDAGIPSFKIKRPAEGSTLICKKAMKFLNVLSDK
jgi:hypothetical protein